MAWRRPQHDVLTRTIFLVQLPRHLLEIDVFSRSPFCVWLLFTFIFKRCSQLGFSKKNFIRIRVSVQLGEGHTRCSYKYKVLSPTSEILIRNRCFPLITVLCWIVVHIYFQVLFTLRFFKNDFIRIGVPGWLGEGHCAMCLSCNLF